MIPLVLVVLLLSGDLNAEAVSATKQINCTTKAIDHSELAKSLKELTDITGNALPELSPEVIECEIGGFVVVVSTADDQVTVKPAKGGLGVLMGREFLFVFQDDQVAGTFEGMQDWGFDQVGYSGVLENGDRVKVNDLDGDGEPDMRFLYRGDSWRSETQVRGTNGWYTFQCGEDKKCGFLDHDGTMRSAKELGIQLRSKYHLQGLSN